MLYSELSELGKCERQLELISFSGDRNNRPCIVNWFLIEILQYVDLEGEYAWGLTDDSKKVNALLSFLPQDP